MAIPLGIGAFEKRNGLVMSILLYGRQWLDIVGAACNDVKARLLYVASLHKFVHSFQ